MIKVSKTSKAGARSAVPTGQAWRHQSLNCPSRHVRPISQSPKFSQAYLQLDKQSGQHLRWRDDNHVYLMPSRRAGATILLADIVITTPSTVFRHRTW